jgi:hypothetical protein
LHARSAEPPDRGATCATASHARLFLSLSIAHGCTLSVFVPHSCSTAQCLAQIDWLTCRISSTSSSFAIGIGNPLLFGAGVHRSDWLSCTSSLLCSWCTRPAKARRDPSDRSAFEFHCEPLRRTSSRYRVSTLSHWLFSSRAGMAGSVVLPAHTAPGVHPSTPLRLCCPSSGLPYRRNKHVVNVLDPTCCCTRSGCVAHLVLPTGRLSH